MRIVRVEGRGFQGNRGTRFSVVDPRMAEVAKEQPGLVPPQAADSDESYSFTPLGDAIVGLLVIERSLFGLSYPAPGACLRAGSCRMEAYGLTRQVQWRDRECVQYEVWGLRRCCCLPRCGRPVRAPS